MTSNRVLMIDLSQRELKARDKLEAQRERLQALFDTTKGPNGGLSKKQQKDLADFTQTLEDDIPVDPFYRHVAAHVLHKDWEDIKNPGDVGYLLYGIFDSQRDPGPSLSAEEREIAAVCGLLQLDNVTQSTVDGSTVEKVKPDFVERMVKAQSEYRKNEYLFTEAFAHFSDKFTTDLQSQIDNNLVSDTIIDCFERNSHPDAKLKRFNDGPKGTDDVFPISARSIAAVVRRLATDKVSANAFDLTSRMDVAYERVTGVVDGASPSSVDIDLPDLEQAVDVEIYKDNLDAMQAIYYSFMLEETRIFQVMERIVDLFRQGLLPLSKGFAGDYLFNYYKKTSERITENERRDLYLRAFGAPGGSAVGMEPNRDFNELWLRFISAVSSFARQQTMERLLRNSVPMSVSQEQIRKAGRDLAANLSRNGYGIAYFAATDLQESIIEFRDVLSDTELRSAFGARDMWQVVDFVNVNYLGGARNNHRYRTQSRAGAVIIRWLTKNAERLSNLGGQVIEVEQLVNAQLRVANASNTPMKDPSDWDLVNACEQWLAVGGVQDQSIEQYAQPIESPITTSRPIEMHQIARDAFNSVGINLPTM